MPRKIKKYSELEPINEGIEDFASPSNIKAMRSWTSRDKSDTEYNITTKQPIDITSTDEVEIAKLKMIFYKYDIKFDVKEKTLQLN